MRSSPSQLARAVEQAKLCALAEMASYRLDDLLGELGVDARRAGRMLVGRCPVHAGDNTSAWNLYPDGHSMRGNWVCRSLGCQKIFQPTLIGLVRGVLSREKLGWEAGCGRKNKLYDFMGSVRWLCRFLGKDWRDIKTDAALAEKRRFLADVAVLGRAMPETPEDGWAREFVRGRLALPSPYYLARGYEAKTLDRFDVGECQATDPAHPMFNRVVVPVLDRVGSRVVGVTGRSVFERCDDCERWHEPSLPCPTGDARDLPSYRKWRNSNGFRREAHLYGHWEAKDHIRRVGQVLLLEGPGEVWRAWEAGCRVGEGLFGTSLTDPQQVLLEGSGAMEVVVATNNDEAGQKAAAEIHKQLRRAFRVRVIHPPDNDLGQQTAAEARAWLVANKVSVEG